jgi:hypothetical protein
MPSQWPAAGAGALWLDLLVHRHPPVRARHPCLPRRDRWATADRHSVPGRPPRHRTVRLAAVSGVQRRALPTQRQRAVFPLDADERRRWLNDHPFVFRHGVMLEDLPSAARRLGLSLLQASLSARGFAQARDIMRLNGLLGEVTGRPDEYTEWLYFLSFVGEPGEERPWAWQIDGHHLCLNCTIIGDQLVFTSRPPMWIICAPPPMELGNSSPARNRRSGVPNADSRLPPISRNVASVTHESKPADGRAQAGRAQGALGQHTDMYVPGSRPGSAGTRTSPVCGTISCPAGGQ